MTHLNFTKNGNSWISDEIQVSSDFNIHIERSRPAQFNIMQKTSGEKWAEIPEAEKYANKNVIDVDIQILVPKSIKIISYSEVTQAQYTAV